MNLDIRDLDPADISRSYDVRTRAFGALPAGRRPQWELDVAAAVTIDGCSRRTTQDSSSVEP